MRKKAKAKTLKFKVVSIRLDNKLLNKMKKIQRRHDLTRTDVIKIALDHYLTHYL